MEQTNTKRSWRTTLAGACTLGILATKIITSPVTAPSIIAQVLDPTNLAALSLAIGQIVGADHAVAAGNGGAGPSPGRLQILLLGIAVGAAAATFRPH